MTDIQSATQAAESLGPLAGELSFLSFSLGIMSTGFLAVPILGSSATYALAEALKWPTVLDRPFANAWGFYGILAFATLLGVAMNFTSIDPIKALVLSAVINASSQYP